MQLKTRLVVVTRQNGPLEAVFHVESRPTLVLWRDTKDSSKEDPAKDTNKDTAKDTTKDIAKDTIKDSAEASVFRYHGLDTAREIVRWARRKVEGALRATSSADLQAWLKAERCLVVGFFRQIRRNS